MMISSRISAHQRGFTLVDTLVTLIVLSVGLLAVARLQILTVQNTRGGQMRSQASLLAYDITDRMRANPAGAADGDYDLALQAATPKTGGCRGIKADCNTTEMADFDLAAWRGLLGVYLPQASGSVATVNNGDTVQTTVTVRWIDTYRADQGEEQLVVATDITI
jgi:type IV pilus assembly protein PilV